MMKSSILRQWIRSLPQCHYLPPPHGKNLHSWSSPHSSQIRVHPAGIPRWEEDPVRRPFVRNLNIFSVFSKEARAKEKARLQDELNRGYFDDWRELKKTGGKVAPASTSLTPIAGAPKFPFLEVHVPRGSTSLSLPLDDGKHMGVTLICMAFRASAQSMVVSWSLPFAQKFAGSKWHASIKVFEISLIESSVLSFWPIRKLLLRTMRGANHGIKGGEELERKVMYAFGDTYFLRKTLGVPNLLSGYVFLLDKKGRVRWRASGMATEEELVSMVSCTSRLLEEEESKATQSLGS